MKWYPAYIGLGSNMGMPGKNLEKAVAHLKALSDTQVLVTSPFYRSAPYGPIEQDDFINAVTAVLTRMDPELLMQNLLDIESHMGRKRQQRWGPRIIDLDLLVYSNQSRNSELLVLPHPEIAKRRFVLRPLLDIAPDLTVPGAGSVRRLLNQCEGSGPVQLERNGNAT